MLARPKYTFAGILGLVTLLKTLLPTMSLLVPHVRPLDQHVPSLQLQSLPVLGVFLLNSNNCVLNVLFESILKLFY